MEKILKYYCEIVEEKREGFAASFLRGSLFILSLLYRACLGVIDIFYSAGIKKQFKINVPVVSIGNLTLGGTGKTPFSIFIAEHYKNRGLKPAILTRGYGNDENRIIEALSGIDVFVGQNRVQSAEMAIKNGNNIIILDDGFQHRRIKRDLNIVLLNSKNPFGNGYIFPRGILRESIKSIGRADMVILSKVDRLNEERIDEICKDIKCKYGKEVDAAFKYKLDKITDFNGESISKDSFIGKRVILVSGIGDPSYFHHIAKINGFEIIDKYVYSDHYSYSEEDIDLLINECKYKNIDIILMTEKDFIKIQNLDITRIKDKIRILCVNIEITKNKENLICGFDSIINS